MHLKVHFNCDILLKSRLLLLEREKREQMEKEYFWRILKEHKEAASQLEDQRKELERREKLLQQRRALNDSERRKLHHDRQMVILSFSSIKELRLCLEFWICGVAPLSLTVRLFVSCLQSVLV